MMYKVSLTLLLQMRIRYNRVKDISFTPYGPNIRFIGMKMHRGHLPLQLYPGLAPPHARKLASAYVMRNTFS